MKPTHLTTLIAALFASLFLVAPNSSPAQDAGELYRTARTAFSNGDYETAAALLDQIIRAQPTYVPARALRAQVQQQLDRRGGGDSLKKKCASIIIPKIDFRDVDLKLALEGLTMATSDATGNKFRPNFILNGGDAVGARKVSLQLRGAPLATALEYLGKMTNVNFRYERFAIVGIPQTAVAETPLEEKPLPKYVPVDPFAKKRR